MEKNKTIPKYLICTMTLLLSCLVACLSSCGNSRALVKVRNNADQTTTQIDIRTGNGGTTEVKVNPTVSMDSLSFKFGKNDR